MNLPPLYSETALREGGDAFARAIALGRAGAGAGTLVWVRRSDTCDCAVVLEPEENLVTAQKVIFAGMLAVAEALLAISPPEKPLTLRWPDAVLFDGGLVGGGRIETPPSSEIAAPEWLVFGFTLRVEDDTPDGLVRPACLRDEGFDDFETVPFIESFARHFMQVLDDWASNGPDDVVARWQTFCAGPIGDNLPAALLTPSWLENGEIAV